MSREFGGIAGVHYVSVLAPFAAAKCPALLNGSVPMQWDVPP